MFFLWIPCLLIAYSNFLTKSY